MGTSSSCRAGPRDLRPIPGAQRRQLSQGEQTGLDSSALLNRGRGSPGGGSHLQWEKGKVSPGSQAAWLREAARSTTSRLPAGEGGRGT